MLHEVLIGQDLYPFLVRAEGEASENKVEMEQVLNIYSLINAQVALETYRAVLVRHENQGIPKTKDEIKMFGHDLDTFATDLMEFGLHEADFVSEVVPEGCEGAKENRKALELGVGRTDLRVLDGTYGLGHIIPFKDRNSLRGAEGKVKLVIDPVEGTTKASLNQDGSVAIIAGTLNGEISPIPSEQSSAKYADRIVASPRLNGKVSLSNTTEENIQATMEEFGLSDPSEVEVVVLKRDRNQTLIDELNNLGVSIRNIDSGDLMPAIEALTKDGPIISMGGGGKQEAVIAACAAKALGGVFELRYVTSEGKPTDEFPGIQKLDDVISGKPSDCFVNFASITGVKNLGMSTPQSVNRHNFVQVATITGRQPGMQINNQTI